MTIRIYIFGKVQDVHEITVNETKMKMTIHIQNL